VLDTNVLISAYQFGGKPETILEMAHDAIFISLISEPLKIELVRVLTYKFLVAPELIAETCSRLWEVSEWIDPQKRLDLCSDEPDNRVLECALEGNAQYIVTGDRHLLHLPPIEGIAILEPAEFLVRFYDAHGMR
jgi:putative PIN family toxin of toxin-antitoxin system